MNKFNNTVAKLRNLSGQENLVPLELGISHIVRVAAAHVPRIKKAFQGSLKNGFRVERAKIKSYFNRATGSGKKAFATARKGGQIGGAIGRGIGTATALGGQAAIGAAKLGGKVISTVAKHPLKTFAGVTAAGVLMRPKQEHLIQREPEPPQEKPKIFKLR
jgi:hypothetical protein